MGHSNGRMEEKKTKKTGLWELSQNISEGKKNSSGIWARDHSGYILVKNLAASFPWPANL